MPTQKKFGKLTPDQFRHLVKSLPELRKASTDLSKTMHEKQAKLRELLGPNEAVEKVCSWTHSAVNQMEYQGSNGY